MRPLYRDAVEGARREGRTLGKDPMETLAGHCAGLLPLPPYEVWLRDFEENRAAHASDPAAGAAPPGDEPVLMDVRHFEAFGSEWTAALHLRTRESGWGGFVSFQSGPEGTAHRTAEIFREDDPGEIRARFAGFAASTLEAFLRSVLPD